MLRKTRSKFIWPLFQYEALQWASTFCTWAVKMKAFFCLVYKKIIPCKGEVCFGLSSCLFLQRPERRAGLTRARLAQAARAAQRDLFGDYMDSFVRGRCRGPASAAAAAPLWAEPRYGRRPRRCKRRGVVGDMDVPPAHEKCLAAVMAGVPLGGECVCAGMGGGGNEGARERGRERRRGG